MACGETAAVLYALDLAEREDTREGAAGFVRSEPALIKLLRREVRELELEPGGSSSESSRRLDRRNECERDEMS